MNNKKSLIALALVALVGVVGATFAYFTSSATLNNEFQTGTYSTSVTEEFVSPDNWTPGTTTQKKVNITNKGSVEVAVRASYTETWTSANGTTLNGVRNSGKVAQFAIGEDWEVATDGYYYYKETLGTNETSTDFISSVTFNPNFVLEEGTDIECTTIIEGEDTIVDCENLTTGYAGATYSLDITLETIQADQKWEYEVLPMYAIGDEITVSGETFNVIKDNGDTVTMLAQLSLDKYYRQSETPAEVRFSSDDGWGSTNSTIDLDIQLYGDIVKEYVNNYVTFLKRATGDSTLTGTLITLGELGSLGCNVGEGSYDCINSQHAEWLVNGQWWWTRSASSSSTVLVMGYSGWLFSEYCYPPDGNGVRPVITISKIALKDL